MRILRYTDRRYLFGTPDKATVVTGGQIYRKRGKDNRRRRHARHPLGLWADDIVGLWHMSHQNKMPLLKMSDFKTTVKVTDEGKFTWKASY
jgi:hypothetical protein